MKLIELQHGTLHAVINPHGASCISLRDDSLKVTALREPCYERGVDNPFLYGIPLLWPQNRIDGGEFEFEGRTYRYPLNEPSTGCHLHGELYNADFTVVERLPDRTSMELTAAPREGFPHGYRVSVEYELTSGTLVHRVKISNLSDENMPSFFGLHTTFNVPFVENGNSDDVVLCCQVGDLIEREMTRYLPTGRLLPPDEITSSLLRGDFSPHSAIVSRHYKAAGDGDMRLVDKKARVEIFYEADEKLRYRLIYNGKADEYVCLEPLSSMANCQKGPFAREESGFDFIPPNSYKEYVMKIHLRRI